MFELGVKFLISYFLGSVMGALTIGKLFGNVDVRNQGSGNAGATNALRTQGFLFALAVAIMLQQVLVSVHQHQVKSQLRTCQHVSIQMVSL